jgi:hypothetical protein
MVLCKKRLYFLILNQTVVFSVNQCQTKKHGNILGFNAGEQAQGTKRTG